MTTITTFVSNGGPLTNAQIDGNFENLNDDKVEKSDADFTGRIVEGVYAISGTTPAITPENGTIQTWTLSANSTPTFAAGFTNGSSLTLMIDDGSSYTITWPAGIKWAGGSAPSPLAATGYTVVTLWKVGGVVYGAIVGEMS